MGKSEDTAAAGTGYEVCMSGKGIELRMHSDCSEQIKCKYKPVFGVSFHSGFKMHAYKKRRVLVVRLGCF